MAHSSFKDLVVPNLITSPADVTRLRREVKEIDEYLHAQQLRTPGQPMEKLPKTSRMLDELITSNGFNLLDSETRRYMLEFLNDVAANAPVIHISFATDPTPAFLQKIALWFRQNVHPSVLLQVGLQPAIAAGCVVRTTNKYFDMSLEKRLRKHSSLLLEAMQQTEETPAESPAEVAA